MDPLQQLWHLLNLLAPPLALAALFSAACKALWRHQLGDIAFWRLSAWCGLAAEVANLGGLALTGRDGAMVTYAAMVAALAVTAWLVGFGPWRARRG